MLPSHQRTLLGCCNIANMRMISSRQKNVMNCTQSYSLQFLSFYHNNNHNNNSDNNEPSFFVYKGWHHQQNTNNHTQQYYSITSSFNNNNSGNDYYHDGKENNDEGVRQEQCISIMSPKAVGRKNSYYSRETETRDEDCHVSSINDHNISSPLFPSLSSFDQ